MGVQGDGRLPGSRRGATLRRQEYGRECLRRNRPGPYQVQAAINAVHSDARSAANTDWRQVVQLFDQLLALPPTPVVALNRTVAVAEVDGAAAALELVDALDLGHYHLFHAIRADLLSRLGRDADAAQAYDAAIAAVTNSAERTFLERAREESSTRMNHAQSAQLGACGVAQPRLVLRRGRVNRHGEPAAAVAAY